MEAALDERRVAIHSDTAHPKVSPLGIGVGSNPVTTGPSFETEHRRLGSPAQFDILCVEFVDCVEDATVANVLD